VCALLFSFMGYVNLTENDGNQVLGAIRAYSAFAFYGSFGVLIFALVPVSLSRVVAASQPKVYDRVGNIIFASEFFSDVFRLRSFNYLFGC
jgi:hypothetical protein